NVGAARPRARRARRGYPAPARSRSDLLARIRRDRARAARAHRGGAAMKTTLAVRLAPWVATIALFVIWEAACRIFNIPQFFLPPPTLVFKAIVDYWPALYKHSLFTLSSTLVGFAMAVGFGLALGLAVGWSRAIYAGVYPLMIGFHAIPKARAGAVRVPR